MSFSGVRLLNDDYRSQAGPFELQIAAGTYDVTMISWDAHDDHQQPEQTQEQWYISLDSGYVSPPSNDLPTEQNEIVTVLTGQVIDAATTVSLHHLGQGNSNSVDPVCIGFAPVAEPDVEPVVESPAPDVEPEVKGTIEFAPVTELVPPASKVVRPTSASVAPSVAPAPQLALTGPASSASFAALGVLLVLIGSTMVTSVSRQRLSEA